MADTQRTGAEIALSSVGHIDEINRQRLEEELVREKLQLEIEQVRLQVARTQLKTAITRYETDLIYDALSTSDDSSNLRESIRMNLTEALGNNFINSLNSQYLHSSNQAEARTPDAETTAKEVPLNARHQHIVLFDFDNPTPNQTVEDTSKTTMEFSTSTEEKLEQVKAPDQTPTDSNIENPTPTPTSEAVEAPTENKAQPTTGGSNQSQGK